MYIEYVNTKGFNMEKILDIFLAITFLASFIFTAIGATHSVYFFIVSFYFLNIFTNVLLFSIHLDYTQNKLLTKDYLCITTFSIAVALAIIAHFYSKAFCLASCILFLATTLVYTFTVLLEEKKHKNK